MEQDLLSAAVGIVLGVILEDPLTNLRDNLFHRYKRLFYKKRVALSENFTFGNIKTAWRILDGTGEEKYDPETITTHFENKKPTFSSLVKEKREEIEKEQEKLHKEGKAFSWNGDVLTLQKFLISRFGDEENQSLEMWFHLTDYYTFMATNEIMEQKDMQEKIVTDPNWNQPIPTICNSVGVNLAVVTEDEYLILTKRSSDVASYKDLYHISMNEGLNRALDRNIHNPAPDIYRCAIRGLAEELGVSDISTEQISLLSFGVDIEHSQWGILGVAKINKTAEEVQAWRNRGAKDKWEATEMHLLKFRVDDVVKFIAEHPHWTPSGLTCIYHALVHEFKRARVEAAIAKYIK